MGPGFGVSVQPQPWKSPLQLSNRVGLVSCLAIRGCYIWISGTQLGPQRLGKPKFERTVWFDMLRTVDTPRGGGRCGAPISHKLMDTPNPPTGVALSNIGNPHTAYIRCFDSEGNGPMVPSPVALQPNDRGLLLGRVHLFQRHLVGLKPGGSDRASDRVMGGCGSIWDTLVDHQE